MKIGVIGKGVLGSEVYDYYGNAIFFDTVNLPETQQPHYQEDNLKSVCACDFVFICVPTPSSKGALIVEECVAQVELLKGDFTVVVIKSTMPIGATKILQNIYPEVPILYCPEFLTESVAKTDFRNPDKNIIGYTDKSLDFVYNLKTILPQSSYFSVVESTSAEIIKLSINSYYAMKVVFGNMVYDICEKEGADYDLVKEGFVSDKRITDSHFDIFHGDYRGFGGKCITKDLGHFSGLLSGNSKELVNKIFEYNKELLDGII